MSKNNFSAKTNRLSRESSPYLLQHASNPVDWFGWGDEALEKARSEDKPIFLSIGYSACHWCHVMAQECFEDDEVASLMNENFISIKVDREEMPHIDYIYMQACQVLTGSGGWPLSVIMTPEKQPFFAATYLPKHTRGGLMGMMELIPLISRFWREKRGEVISEASHISRLIKQSALVRPGDDLDEQLLSRAYKELKERFSTIHGGFGPAPKFPSPQNIMFLLRYYRRTGDQEALGMAVKTLASMRTGGIYDHVGHGFHRYSTDEQWLVPHFEKMLYDQALLAIAYTEAFQVTQREDFRKTAEEIISYVLRDMHTEEGLFASAQDADSEGEEGRFYLWNTAEMRSVLDDDDYALALEAFGLRDEGNFAAGMDIGLNIIHLAQDEAGLAERLGLAHGELADRLARILENLRRARTARTAPMKDSKVLADWNGLMIAALAKTGAALDKPGFTEAAKTAADFILDHMLVDGRLRHVYMTGTARLQACLDDYAFFTWGLIELYEATFELKYLDAAIDLNTILLEHFQDHSNGGFYSTAEDDEIPIVRAKTAYDNAYPSGNSVAMLNILRLAGLTGNRGLRDSASRTGKAFSNLVSRLPSAFTFMMCGLDYMTGPNYEVVIAGDPAREDTKEMIRALRSCFLPHAVILLKHDEDSGPSASIMQDKHPLGGKATAYVCSATSCLEPTSVVSKMLDCLG